MKIHFTKMISLVAVCTMMIFAADAATFTAVASGSWSSGATWSGGTAPGTNITSDEIIIGSGITVDLDQDVTIASVVVLSGSLTVDGTLSSTSAGRTLTFTGGRLQGSGSIQLSRIRFQLASTLEFTGDITADEVENTLSLVTVSKLKANQTLRLQGGLTVDTGGKLELNDHATIIIQGGSIASSGTGSLVLSTPYDVSYQTSSATSGIELSGAGLKSVTVDVGQANTLTLDNDVTINDSLRLITGVLDLNTNNLILKGDLSAAGTGTITSSDESDITIEGTGALSGWLRFTNTGNTVRNLTINRTTNGHVQLGSDLDVAGILNLTSGSLRIGNYVLDIMDGGSIIGASKDNYIVTGASGRLGIMLTAGANFVNYPVGTADRYIPAAARLSTGSSGMVRVNVINEVYSEGTTGTDLSATGKMVKGTWNVTSEITSNMNLDIKLMWAAASEVNSFNRTNSYISHYTANEWDVVAGVAANSEMNNMYSLTRTDITSLSPFSVREGGSTGVADIARLNNIAVYPNPAVDRIIINNTEKVNIEIMNELGQVVKTTVLTGAEPLNLSELQRGNYFIKISSESASVVKKIVKL